MKLVSEGHIATVVEISNDSVVAVLDSNIRKKESCDTCGAKIICSPETGAKKVIKLDNYYQAKVGDRVLISEKDSILLKISFYQYILPLLGFVSGIIGFNTLGWDLPWLSGELWSFIAGLAFLFIIAIFSRYFITQLIQKEKNAIFIIEKIIRD